MSSRFSLAARTLALTLLGAGTFAVADAGCGNGVAVTDLCQRLCDCSGCNATQRQACESGFNDSQKLAGDKGCADAYDTYLSCIDEHFQCVANAVDTKACAAETTALDKCTGGGTMVPGSKTTVACDLPGPNLHTCTKYPSTTSDLAQPEIEACKETKGTASTTCPTAGALGVCKISSGGFTFSDTYYSDDGVTADFAENLCQDTGGKWTAN